ncbi:MAG: MtnX-like HAD-IB family phosphatase [Chloroflexi bacterium]|nr:MtnX-like HAD-IB family phosphatase [Chloroflexota bacterium]
MTKNPKTLVQCDFDGTITEGDVSFFLLDAFGSEGWRQLFKDYEDGKISVGRFNTEAFSSVKADKKTLLEIVRRETKVRPGFQELVACCRRKGLRFVIVSNGLRFYIDDILERLGLADLEVFAAETKFHPGGLKVQYIGPGGDHLDNDFKLAFAKTFLDQGYRLIYVGNGSSDLTPAKKSERIFATGTLLERCQSEKLDCIPFTDLHQVARAIEAWGSSDYRC